MKKGSIETAIMSVIVSVAILAAMVWAGHWSTSYLVDHRQDIQIWSVKETQKIYDLMVYRNEVNVRPTFSTQVHVHN